MNAERIRRAIRNHPALWGDDTKAEQCQRILRKTADRLRPQWNERAAQVKHAAGQRLLRTYS